MVKVQVFADTNVILEAFRTGCWTAITSLEGLARRAGVGRVNLDALALQYRDD
jgi:hypothetical protein